MNFKGIFLLKKKIFFKKLEIIYKIYTFIHIRYFYLKYKVNKNLIVFKSLLIRQKCIITQRTKSTYKLCGLSRFKIKEFLSVGFIPNLRKLSW